MDTINDKPKLIAALNDVCRQALGLLPGCRGLQTAGITALPPEDQLLIRQKVSAFDAFNDENDPHGEHDFGGLEHNGHRVFWKIDYYTLDMESGSEDTSDAAQTVRVLTVLLAEEY